MTGFFQCVDPCRKRSEFALVYACFIGRFHFLTSIDAAVFRVVYDVYRHDVLSSVSYFANAKMISFRDILFDLIPVGSFCVVLVEIIRLGAVALFII